MKTTTTTSETAALCPVCKHPLRQDTEQYFWCVPCGKLFELDGKDYSERSSSRVGKLANDQVLRFSLRHLKSAIKPGDEFGPPLRVVLHESLKSNSRKREFVTHLENMRDGSRYWGHYFMVTEFEVDGSGTTESTVAMYGLALADYEARCLAHNVDPLPARAVRRITVNDWRVMEGQHELCEAYGKHLDVMIRHNGNKGNKKAGAL